MNLNSELKEIAENIINKIIKKTKKIESGGKIL